jgi:hypothetical protein
MIAASCILGYLRLNLSLQVKTGHLGQAEQVNCDVRQLLADTLAALSPGIERLRHLTLKQAELKRDVSRIEAL